MSRLVASVLVVAFLVSGCVSHSHRTDYGDRMPSFSVLDIDGRPFDSKDLAGKIVVLHYLSSRLENDPDLGFAAMETILANLTEVPETKVVTIYWSYWTTETPQSHWESVRSNFNVTWTLLPDQDGSLKNRIGAGQESEAHVVIFGQDGRLQAHVGRSFLSDHCIKEVVRELHRSPDAEPRLYC